MKVSLNLAESYVPEWGTWEVAREIICNAKDAGTHTVETPASDTLIVKTKTAPSFAELIVMGASTKRFGESKIGQFGEGFKLATLVATRLGGSVEARTPEGRITFSLVDTQGITDRVLWASINKKFRSEGCEVTVKLSGIAGAIQGKFTDFEEGFIPKDFLSPAKIFSKGVFICALGQYSIYDWNIPVKLNRDRAVVDSYDVKTKIASFYAIGALPLDAYKALLKNKGSLEYDSMYHIWSHSTSADGKTLMQTAWNESFGEKAVLASSKDQINEIAFGKGYRVISFRSEIKHFGIKTADEVVQTSDTFEEVVVADNIVEECNLALDLMDIPATVAFFKDFADAPLGKACWEDGICIAWINERLSKPGNRKLRLATLAHELCHIDSKSGDCSTLFEYKLDEVCGKLLEKLL